MYNPLHHHQQPLENSWFSNSLSREVEQIDMNNAFSEGDLEEQLFMVKLKGFENKTH